MIVNSNADVLLACKKKIYIEESIATEGRSKTPQLQDSKYSFICLGFLILIKQAGQQLWNVYATLCVCYQCQIQWKFEKF